MAFGTFDGESRSALMTEINMIPLIDVMLVLLVIFLITAPLLTHAVKIELPNAVSRSTVTPPENVQLGIKANGELYWNGERVDSSALSARMVAAARADPQPELQLHADRTTEYQRIADVLSAAARAGLTRIGFITDPVER